MESVQLKSQKKYLLVVNDIDREATAFHSCLYFGLDPLQNILFMGRTNPLDNCKCLCANLLSYTNSGQL